MFCNPLLDFFPQPDIDLVSSNFQETVDQLARTQQRGIDNQLFNQASEVQEDISMKKFDLRAKQLHLTAIVAQVRELVYMKIHSS